MKKFTSWPSSAIAVTSFLAILSAGLGAGLWKSNVKNTPPSQEEAAPVVTSLPAELDGEPQPEEEALTPVMDIPVLQPEEDGGIRFILQSSQFRFYSDAESYSYVLEGEIEPTDKEIHELTVSITVMDSRENIIFSSEETVIDKGDFPLFPGETKLFNKLFYGTKAIAKPEAALVSVTRLRLENAADYYGGYPEVPVDWRPVKVQGTDIKAFLREDSRLDSFLGYSASPIVLVENTGRRTISLLFLELRILGGDGEILAISERYLTPESGALFRSGKKVPLNFYFLFKDTKPEISGYLLSVKNAR